MHTWSKLDYSIYKVSGADAETFLQGQISQDVNAITTSQAQLAAYCNAKGRMFALLLLFRDSDNNLYLRINDSIGESVIKRLKMFVLRSKVSFERMDFIAYGFDIASAIEAFPHIQENAKDLECQLINNSYLIKMPGIGRFECYTNAGEQAKIEATLNEFNSANASAYAALDIQSGFYNIEPHSSESILPQTTPIEDWGGINYTKGCYVGQEIIARSHYRGTVKRKLMVAESNSQIAIGDSIYDGENAVAEVLMSNYNDSAPSPYFISAILSLDYENKALLINGEPHQFAGIAGGKS